MDRRTFLTRTGAAAGGLGAGLGVPAALRAEKGAGPRGPRHGTGDVWEEVRAHFELDPEWIHMAGLLLASHPIPVRRAIDGYRGRLDANPALTWEDGDQEAPVRRAAAAYLQARPEDIALTDSTTMGLATLYNGLVLREGDEILTTTHDHYSTSQSLELKARRSGASLRRIDLYEVPGRVSAGSIVDRLAGAVGPRTRAVAVTWVHSSTGVRLPVPEIARALAEVNQRRGAAERVLLCVDAVHGFGVEDITVDTFGADFFAAGTHKWLFGPRGTGILWGRPQLQDRVSPTIPTFSGWATWGQRMTPGGFHSFEHRWALDAAFDFHREIGKARIRERIHALNRRMKEGLAEMPHVTLYTPLGDDVSAGIVCFDVRGLRQRQTVARLEERRIIASSTPYAVSYARVTPGLINSEEEVERTLEAVAALA